MPNIKSAKKRVKTNLRDELRNRTAKASLKTALKRANVATAGEDKAAAAAELKTTQALIARTHKRGIIHKNKAARLQSKLMKRAAKSAA